MNLKYVIAVAGIVLVGVTTLTVETIRAIDAPTVFDSMQDEPGSPHFVLSANKGKCSLTVYQGTPERLVDEIGCTYTYANYGYRIVFEKPGLEAMPELKAACGIVGTRNTPLILQAGTDIGVYATAESNRCPNAVSEVLPELWARRA